MVKQLIALMYKRRQERKPEPELFTDSQAIQEKTGYIPSCYKHMYWVCMDRFW